MESEITRIEIMGTLMLLASPLVVICIGAAIRRYFRIHYLIVRNRMREEYEEASRRG